MKIINEIMTDKEFQKRMDITAKLHSKYVAALSKIEEEYKRRYGNYPHEIDDDFFIDSFSQTLSGATVKQVEENAKLHAK